MLTPTNEAELALAITEATGALSIQGGGTRLMPRLGSHEHLTTSGLSGITLYEPGALTLVAGAGTPVSLIQKALAAEGQRLAFEPMDHRVLLGTSGEPTIGGVIASNASGPRRIQVGAARDFLLGVRFVDGAGRVLKNGGRVMKNVTGYDLAKLMAGSFGTLGVISEVSLKVLPDVESTQSLIIQGLSPKDAIRAMSLALGSPFEVTGAAHTGADKVSETLIRLEGSATSVKYRAEKLSDLLGRFGDVSVLDDPERVAQQWAAVRDVAEFASTSGDVWRISVRPSDASEIVERLPSTCDVRLDWGGGLMWVSCESGLDLRSLISPFSGHATRVKAQGQASETIPRFQPEPAALAAISAGIRAKFDPRNILNPGLMA